MRGDRPSDCGIAEATAGHRRLAGSGIDKPVSQGLPPAMSHSDSEEHCLSDPCRAAAEANLLYPHADPGQQAQPQAEPPEAPATTTPAPAPKPAASPPCLYPRRAPPHSPPPQYSSSVLLNRSFFVSPSMRDAVIPKAYAFVDPFHHRPAASRDFPVTPIIRTHRIYNMMTYRYTKPSCPSPPQPESPRTPLLPSASSLWPRADAALTAES